MAIIHIGGRASKSIYEAINGRSPNIARLPHLAGAIINLHSPQYPGSKDVIKI